MKLKGPDGKYVLEGAENWFSMTMFDNTISNNKLEKILDILDWLLSEEGTRFAVYGIENFDYTMVNGQPVLIEENWPQNPDGNYLNKVNGARYLRYTVSLGLETYEYDPTTDKTALSILNDWESEMKTAFTNNQLKVLIENPEVAWLTTQLKSQYSAYLQNDGFINSMKYIYGRYNSINEYKNAFNVHWPLVLDEINTALGK